MTDQHDQNHEHDQNSGHEQDHGHAPGADESFDWTASDEGRTGDARATADRMLGQLQSMIDALATQAAPVVAPDRGQGRRARRGRRRACRAAGPARPPRPRPTPAVASPRRSRTWAADLRSGSSGPTMRMRTAAPSGDTAPAADDRGSQPGQDERGGRRPGLITPERRLYSGDERSPHRPPR